MVDIRPFTGWRFDSKTTGSLDQVITPPYDVISPDDRARLAHEPHSFVHVILPQAENGISKYENARLLLDQWSRHGALKQDESDSYYLLRQTFTDLKGQRRVRRGFFAVTRLPEEGEKIILGHERTFDKPVEDRLRLTEATEANLGPVFVMYSDADGALAGFLSQMDERAPDETADTIDGVHQELWRVSPDPKVAAHLKDQRLYIADGHHRFQTARLYRKGRQEAGAAGEQPFDYVLMGFVAFEDPGLAIFAPHRLVKWQERIDQARFLENLSAWFEVTPLDIPALKASMSEISTKTRIGLICCDGSFLLELRDVDRKDLLGDDRAEAWRDLDVAVLHRGILEHLLGVPEGTEFEYEKDIDRAGSAVADGRCDLAFLLQPTRPEQVKACAEAEEPMPQKSTYFFPKLPSGAVIYRFTS